MALVTGGSRGIGRSICLALARMGAAVGPVTRTANDLARVAGEIRAAGGLAPREPLVADVRRPAEVEAAARTFAGQFGPCDILVAAAGVASFTDMTALEPEEWTLHLDVNLSGAYHAIRAVLPGMLQAGRGDIVTIGSVASIKGFAGGAAYGASKSGLRGLAMALREEVRDRGVRVISVLPGATDTVLWGNPPPAPPERMIHPDTIGEAVAFAVAADRRAVVEEILIRPLLGDL